MLRPVNIAHEKIESSTYIEIQGVPMGCTSSFLSFPKALEFLQAGGVKVVSFHTIDACKRVHTAHLQYKLVHFQFTYLSGKLILSNRSNGRSRFPTIAGVLLAIQSVADGKNLVDNLLPFDQYSIYADIWKDELPNMCEVRLNFVDVPVSHRLELVECVQKVFESMGVTLRPMTNRAQMIGVVSSHRIPELKRKFLGLPSNPIYDWRNYT